MNFLYTIFFIITGYLLSAQNIDAILESYKKDKDLLHASYSFCVVDASTGKMIKEFNSELSLIPASTLKIITTSAALGVLGKDYTYKTKFYTATQTDSLTKKVATNLYVKGSGDPTFNSTYFNNNDSLFLTSILNNLKSGGLKKISGTLYADNSCFENSIPETWIWGDIGNYFGAGANGLSYKDNKFSVYLNSGSLNTNVELNTIKPDYYKNLIKINLKVKAFGNDDNAFIFGDPNNYSNRYIAGTIPPNKKNYEVEAQSPNPQLFFATELANLLKKNNLMDDGNKVTEYSDATPNYEKNSQLIYTYNSPPLAKIVFYTNTKSNNHYAETLLKTVGLAKSGKIGTTENGIAAIIAYWKARGVDVSGLHMADGSGLSRANTVTTKIQTTILSKIYRDSSMYSTFNASLPVAGKSGSMTNLCKGTFAENNMRAKTGYINNARGYCGYVKTKSGKELAFSVLFNNYDCTAKEMKLKIEKLLIALVDL